MSASQKVRTLNLKICFWSFETRTTIIDSAKKQFKSKLARQNLINHSILKGFYCTQTSRDLFYIFIHTVHDVGSNNIAAPAWHLKKSSVRFVKVRHLILKTHHNGSKIFMIDYQSKNFTKEHEISKASCLIFTLENNNKWNSEKIMFCCFSMIWSKINLPSSSKSILYKKCENSMNTFFWRYGDFGRYNKK